MEIIGKGCFAFVYGVAVVYDTIHNMPKRINYQIYRLRRDLKLPHDVFDVY
ncbi:MAG: hypothetical protein MK052_01360 [Alphaproteobacteria bacterium]|nr:hypothetical protein [Alphaproteobacteria bacterium]